MFVSDNKSVESAWLKERFIHGVEEGVGAIARLHFYGCPGGDSDGGADNLGDGFRDETNDCGGEEDDVETF